MKIITSCLMAVVFSFCVYSQNAKKSYKAGEEFYQSGNYKDAIAQFTSAISLNPDYLEAYYKRGLSYEKTREYQKAADDFKRAIVFDQKNEEIYYHLGKVYNELKLYNDALPALNTATTISRRYLSGYQEKVKTLIALEQNYNALKVSDTTLMIEGNALNYYLQGLVTAKLNSAQKAETAFNNAIKRDKKFIEAFIELAKLQVSQNRPDEAMINCNEAIKINPNSQEALIVRSQVYLKKLDYPKAIDDISKALVLSPNDESLFFMRGDYYQQFNQHQNAINDFSKVISINGQNAEAFYKRAKSYEEISNLSAAIKDYEALTKISEFDAKAKQLLKQAQDRLFELNRESEKPQIVILDPAPKDKILNIPGNKKQVKIKGYLTDKSGISFLKINDNAVAIQNVDGQNQFTTDVAIGDSIETINILASDVYNNVENLNYKINRTEIDPPKVAIMSPIASDNGEIFLDNDAPSLYIEGKVTDANLVKSIVIDGVLASFKPDELNPSFSASIAITNKNNFAVTATDIYGNEKPCTFTLNRENVAMFESNPMGKTWVVFIENSNYKTFASLEGPTKDVSLMKASLAKYQVNNIIHKKDLTKDQMEKFFSIELRDLIKSNKVNTLLLWYAGHGKFINETGYWIPIDANRDDEFTYFNITFLKASLQAYSSALTHTLVVTDACESGPSFYQAMRGAIKERSCNDWQASRLKSSQVFSSAGYELAQDVSQFTQTFANLLASNPNACMPIESIVLKVNSAVAQNSKQKPKFGKISGMTDEDGTFFFIAKEKK
jgi:tetratricopeptide (TPR) repeat protein